MAKSTEKSDPTNGGKVAIEAGMPYTVTIKVRGTADLLFHRWNPEAVDDKAAAAKGSKAKKTDDIESYVFRDDDGHLCVPGEYLRQSIITAAKFKQDPRSARKSAMDLYKAAVVSLTHWAKVTVDGKPLKDWHYEDRRRVTVMRAGINRTRPAVKAGYEAEFDFLVTLPEYVTPDQLADTVAAAGRVVGLADFRPTYGRFAVTSFQVGSYKDRAAA